MRTRIVIAVVIAVATAGMLTAEVPELRTVDPLTLPAPEVGELVLPADTRSGSDKVVSRLWEKATAASSGETIRVIVTLHEPVLPDAGKLGDEAREELRVEHVAAVQHAFAAKAAALGASEMRGLSHFPIVFLDLEPNRLSPVAALPEVRAIEDNAAVHALRSEGTALMKAGQLRTGFGGTGAGKGVAIIDSGIDCYHPELTSRIVAQGDFTGTAESGCADGAGHGTAVAGIVAGTSGGVAPLAMLWALKVLNNEGTGTQQMTLDALNSAYANRSAFGGLHVVNMSLGATSSKFNSDCDASFSSYATVVNQLVNSGIAVFAASGNDGFLDGINVPGCLSGVISVGAVTDQAFNPDPLCGGNRLADSITCYSNSGVPLDLLAPSHCARTPSPGGGYNNCFNGTSAASPYAAGVAAQILSLRPGTSPAALRSALMTTGKPITDVNGITRGRVEAVAAYQALVPSTGPCVEDTTTACLLNSRFRARVRYRNGFDNGLPDTYALRKPVTGFANPNFETEFFYFNDVNNIEVLLKMLDQGNVDPQGYPTIAVLFGSATPLRLEITITDTQKGVTRTYSNQFGSQQGSTDFTAFRK